VICWQPNSRSDRQLESENSSKPLLTSKRGVSPCCTISTTSAIDHVCAESSYRTARRHSCKRPEKRTKPFQREYAYSIPELRNGSPVKGEEGKLPHRDVWLARHMRILCSKTMHQRTQHKIPSSQSVGRRGDLKEKRRVPQIAKASQHFY
jgi:hypothetical protein